MRRTKRTAISRTADRTPTATWPLKSGRGGGLVRGTEQPGGRFSLQPALASVPACPACSSTQCYVHGVYSGRCNDILASTQSTQAQDLAGSPLLQHPTHSARGPGAPGCTHLFSAGMKSQYCAARKWCHSTGRDFFHLAAAGA
eukprot:1157949-Pelagomonas_calceolata.AAC.2